MSELEPGKNPDIESQPIDVGGNLPDSFVHSENTEIPNLPNKKDLKQKRK